MPLLGYTQDYFNRLFENTGSTFGSVAEYEETYIVRGTGRNPSGTGTLVFAKTDLVGEVIKVDTFSIDSIATFNGVFTIYDDKIALFNTVNDSRGENFPPDPSNNDLQFSILDLDFNVEKTFIWGGGIKMFLRI